MGYLSRLSRDIDRWTEQGWVAPDHRQAILDDASAQSRHWTTTGALALLGAILLALSALTFVAANWEVMPRMVRFGLILLALWLSLMGAGRAFDRKAPAIGHALAVLGVALFGIAILLTAQTFNMASFRNTAVLIWSLAGLVTALALPSRPVLILSALLGVLWAGLEIFNPFFEGIIWVYLPLWLASLVLAIRLNSAVTIHLLAAALIAWVAHALYIYAPESEIDGTILHSAAVLMYGGLALASAVARDRGVSGGGVLAAWLAVVTVVLGVTLQFQIDGGWAGRAPIRISQYLPLAVPALILILVLTGWRVRTGDVSVKSAAGLVAAGLLTFSLPFLLQAGSDGLALRFGLGALIYAACIALIVQGSEAKGRAAGVIGICAFIGQTLYIYAETFGGLLDTALFFGIGGLILVALSLGIMQWRRARPAPDEGDAS